MSVGAKGVGALAGTSYCLCERRSRGGLEGDRRWDRGWTAGEDWRGSIQLWEGGFEVTHVVFDGRMHLGLVVVIGYRSKETLSF